MNSKQNLSDIVFNKKLFTIFLCTYFVPFFCSWIAFVFLKEFTFAETLVVVFSPVGIGGLIGITTFVLTWWFTSKKRFSNFDPNSPASVKRINKLAKSFQNITLATAIANGAVCAALVQISFSLKGIPVDNATLYTTCVGNVIVISDTFYIYP